MSEESKSWYRMTRPLFNSGFEDDEFWAYGQDGFQEVLDSFLGSDVLIYDKTLRAEPKRVRAVIQNVTSDVYNSTTVRQILCSIGILRCGQYVKIDDVFWLVSALPDHNGIYEKAVLWKCKYTIRFLSPVSGDMVEYPVFNNNSTQYGVGELKKTNLTVGESQHLVFLPFNEETILLDNGFRFLMDKNRKNPTAYRVTQVDPISYAVGSERDDDGLIRWTVLETQFNSETDNQELMVADYYSVKSGSSEIQPGTAMTLRLTDLDGDLALAIGETKQIRVDCFDENGEPVSEFDYTMEYDLSDGAAQVTAHEGNLITLYAEKDRRYIGKTITIRAVNERTESEATMKIQIVNW